MTTEQTEQTEQKVYTIQSVETNVKTPSEYNNNSVRKAGRTLLVKSASNNTIDNTIFSCLEGLTNKSETKSINTFFLTFDNISNATKAFNKFRNDSTINVKFSYYRIFFTIDGLTESTDYNHVKKEFIEYIDKTTASSVLYCKFYRKNNKFIGCGDFTIDTFTGMNILLAKDSSNKEYSFGSFKGIFYSYNGKRLSQSE